MFLTAILGGGVLILFGLLAFLWAGRRPHWTSRVTMSVVSAIFLGGGGVFLLIAWKIWTTQYGHQP